MHPTHVPLRLATGAYIVNSGIKKLKADDEAAEQAHGWASSVYPVFKDMKAKDFMKLLGVGEIGVGALLLLPTVPSAVAGAALTAFGAGLTGMYLNTPGMTESDGIRPTSDGAGLAKDVWLVGAGLTLASQSFLSGTRHAAKAVAGGVTGAAASVAGGVTGAATSVASGVTGKVGSASHSAGDGVRGLLEGAHHAREELADALADLAESVIKR
ncbi:hypothetical protein GCM10009584_01660 [Ornithinimicrobium humiphilum]|uniref:DoxX-like protein n=1 Tax=Ornithinimicrobium humiphilum TaxID=125288 RepID=A0A543KRM7_9MICO|nr:hypothetical protein [Ornithinimicrobium humiphilum]TQM97729.1 hypothetical protein FB476_2654 [Ornithinimicrobium humiphilum]